MDKQKEIEEMAKVIFESGVALEGADFTLGVNGDDHFTRLAQRLINAGYGNVKQAVREFAEELKASFYNMDYSAIAIDNKIDNLITELYRAEEE